MSEARMPTEDEMNAFYRGDDAHGRGTPKHANPYLPGDTKRDFWWFGWEHANHEPNAVHQDEENDL